MFTVLLKKTLRWKEHVKLLLRLILAMFVCTVIRQESKDAGGQRSIVRHSKQNKTDFED